MPIKHPKFLAVSLASALAVALWADALAGNQTTITGTVVGVTDGDTITLLEDGHAQIKIVKFSGWSVHC